MMFRIFCLFLVIALSACGSSNSPIPAELEGYEIIDIPTVENASIATAITEGHILETGTVVNGAKQGTWVTYYPGKTQPKIIANYMDGILNGAYMTYATNGQLTVMATCINGNFDGYYTEFESNRKMKEQYFINGQLDGEMLDYFPRTEKIRAKINYKMGVLEGKSTYYNEEGQVIQEYEYKNGEQVAGGVVEGE